jgi:hypothetical protein
VGRARTILIAVLIIFIVGAGVSAIGIWKLRADTYSSEYRYDLTISTDAPLRNVTFIVPLPVQGGGSLIADRILRGDASGIPDGWDVAILEAEDILMLRISTDEIVPVLRNRPAPLPIGEGSAETSPGEAAGTVSGETGPVSVPFRITVTADASGEIQTKNPAGAEPLLMPRYNETRIACDSPDSDRPDPPQCFSYESSVYTAYETNPGTQVSIEVVSLGANQWWVLGWSSNEYCERITMSQTGNSTGWSNATGHLLQGAGRYAVI